MKDLFSSRAKDAQIISLKETWRKSKNLSSKLLTLAFICLSWTAFGASPTVTSFSPKSASAGSSITITGTNFSSTPANDIVSFGGVRATVTAASVTSLTVTVPKGARFYPLSVTVSGQTAFGPVGFILTFPSCKPIRDTTAFPSRATFTATGNPVKPVAADINGDGLVDVITFDSSSSTMSVFINTTVGGVVSFSRSDYTTAAPAASGSIAGLSVQDIDGDGKPDIILASSNTMSIFQNTSTGGSLSLGARVDFTGLSGIPMSTVTAADINNDGKIDIVVCGDSIVSYWTNVMSGSGTISTSSFGSRSDITVTSSKNLWDVVIRDLDKDGNMDIIVSDHGTPNTYILQGKGSLSYSQAYLSIGASSENQIAAVDLDLDGKIDLVVANNGVNKFSVFRNTTTTAGTITFGSRQDITTPSVPNGFAIADLDGDGYPEVIATAANGVGGIRIYPNTSSSGSISFSSPAIFSTVGYNGHAAIADINGDGIPDIISAATVNNLISVRVNNDLLPLAYVGSATPGTVCAGKATTFGGSSVNSNTYSWTSSPSGFTSTVSNPTANPLVSATYTLVEKTVQGCSASNSVSVVVNALPAALAGSSITQCTGAADSIGAAAVTGSTYSWVSSPTGFTSALSKPRVTPTVTTTYTVTETNTNGCVASNSVTITISTPAAAAGSSQAICTGGSATIGAAAVSGSTYSWVSSPSGFTSAVANPSVSPTATTTYAVTETNSFGCVASNSVTVTVNALPAAASGTASSVCPSGAASIGAAAVSGSTYSWTSSPSGYSSTASTATVNPTATTTYTVKETNSNGCVNSNSVTVTVYPLPAAAAGTSTTICLNSSATIGAAAVTGSTYSWVSLPTGFTSAVANPTVSPSVATKYTVTETNSNGCVNSNSVTISISIPAAAAGTAKTVCSGSAASIGATAVSGSFYSWTSDPSGFTATTATATVNPTVSTVYTVKEINSLGCVNSNSVAITVNALPAAVPGVAATTCAGSTVAVGGSAVTGSSYSWASTPAGFSSASSNPIVAPTTTTKYTVTETNANGCKASNAVTITVNPLPAAAAGANTAICSGSDTIGAVAVNKSKYSWVSSPTGFTSTLARAGVTPLVTTTYTVTQTDSNGCVNSNSVIVTYSVAVAAAGSPATICSGVSVTLGAAAVKGSTYVWSPAASLSSPNVSNPVASPTATTTYKVVETNSTGCKDSNTVTITVNGTLPLAYPGSPATICNGFSTKIGNNNIVSGDVYSWSPTTGLSSSTISNPTAAPTSTTTYTVTETTPTSGCTNSRSVTITVSSAAAAAGSNRFICNGSSTTLGAANVKNSTYTWAPSASLSSSTISNPVANPTSATTYTVTETNSNGCVASNTVNVGINPLPAAAAGSAATFCAGTPTSIGAAAVSKSTYAWLPKTALSSSTVSNPTASPTTTTSYTVTQTDSNGCVNSNSVTLTVNSLPAAAAGSNAAICIGSYDSIGAAAVTGSTYAWSPTTSLSSGTAAKPRATPTSTTTYTVTETNSNSCVASHTVTVTVNALPAAAAGSNVSVCIGGSATIGATPVSGSSYSWSPTTNLSSATASKPTATPTTTTTYTITETNANGCVASNSVTVTVNALPAAAAGSAATVCKGISTTIGATAVTGSTYSWTSSPSGFTSATANPSVSPTATTTYTVKETNANGCVASNSVTVTVNALPVAAAGAAVSVCSGKPANLGATAVTGSSYSWSPSTGLSSTTISNPQATIISSTTATTTYSLTETNSNGCVASNTVNVTVNVAAAAAGASRTICSGSPTTLGANPVSGSTYNWSSNPSGFTATIGNPVVAPTTTTSYTVVETNVTGCFALNNVTVTVNPLPAAAAGSNATICTGGSSVIGSTAVAGSTYSWTSNPSGFTSTVSNPTVSPLVNTSYTLTETNSNGCKATNSVLVTISIPAANAGSSKLICTGGSTVIGASPIAGSSYLWSPSTGLSSATVSNPTATPASNTTYTVTETNSFGCTNSNSVSVTITVPVAAAGSPATFCVGGSATIGGAAVSGSTYAWLPTTGLSSATAANPKASPTTTTTYTVTETNSTGCTASNSVTITVNPLPAASAGTSTIVCAGTIDTIGAVAVSGSTYAWTSIPVGFTSALAKTTVNPVVTTKYFLTETNVYGCVASNSLTITISVPVAAAGAAQSICTGGSTTIGAASVTGSTYAWGSIPSGFSSTVSNPTVTPTGTTIYKVTEINSLGCTNSNSVTVTINTPAANAGTSAVICSGTPTGIGAAAVSGSTYSWVSSPAGFTSALANPTVSPTSTTSYTLTETNSTGCVNSNSITLTTNPVPSASAGASTAICIGGSATIGAASVSGNTYEWTSSPVGYSSSLSTNSVSPTVTTTYTVSVTNTSGCKASASSTITVNALPAAAVSAAQTICTGTSASIGAAAVTGSTYSWSGLPTAFTSASANPSVSPTASNTYTLTETNSNGCKASNSVSVTVNPVPTALAGTASTICSGNSANIGAASVSGNTYSWASSPSGYSSSLSLNSVSPTVTTTYSITTTNASSCSATGSVTVTVNALPAAAAGSAVAVCVGGSASIGAAAVTGSTYLWSPATNLSSKTVANPTATPATTTTYTVTETNSSGCVASNSVTVTVNAFPAAATGGNQTICSGNSATIGATAVTGSSYSWTDGTTNVYPATSTLAVTPTSTTSYTLTETNAAGCVSSNALTVTVNSVPSTSASVAANTTLCSGTAYSIGAASVTGITYSWASSPTGFTSALANPSVSATTTTTYTVTLTNTSGCSASNSVTVTVSIPVAAAGSAQSVCAGNSVTIGAAAVTGSAYSWSPATGLSSATVSNPTATITANTTYTVTETNSLGCKASNSVTVKLNPAVAAVAASTTICAGQPTNIGAAAVSGSTYSWVSSPAGFSSASSNPLAAPTTTTTYTVTETNVTGCTASNSVTLTVSPSPAAATGPAQSICLGGSANIGSAAITGNTYSWTSNPTGFVSAASKASVTPVQTTTYTLTEISAFGCPKTNSVTITVNPLPLAATGPAVSACAGGSVSIGAAAVTGDSYSWTPITNLSSATVANPTVTPTSATTYTLVETTAAGCTATNTVSVGINPLPIVSAGAAQTTCAGVGVTIGPLSVPGGSSFSWGPSKGLSGTNVANPTAAPTSTTTYTLTQTTTATGCSATATVTVTTNPLPVAAAGSNSSICLGGSGATIGAAAVTGDTYSWTSNVGGYASTASTASVTPLVTTIYTVTETNTATGCFKSNSVTVTINTPAASAGSNTAICAGGSTTIGAAAVSGSTYAWVSSLGGFSSSLSNPTVSPASTATYTVTETNSTGCTNSNPVTVTVNPLPAANVGSSSAVSVCSGSSTTIGTVAVGSNTYSWSPITGITSPSASSTLVRPIATTTYTLTETTPSGCKASNAVTITLNLLPAANAGSNGTVCSGNSYTIGAGAVTGSTYSWSPATGLSSSTVSSPVATPSATTTYFVTETNVNGCHNSSGVIVTVNPLPTANVASSQTVCSGTAYSIGAGSVTGNAYSWAPSTGLSSTTSSNPSAKPASATTYTLTQTITATGCAATATVNVGINALPAAAAGANGTVCSGVAYTIGAAQVTGSSYSWTDGTATIYPSTSSIAVTPVSTTIYTVTETNINGCIASNSVKVTVNTPAAAAGSNKTICAGSSTTIGAASVTGSTYSWGSSLGGFSSSLSNPTVSPASTAIYTVTETNSTGCTNSNSDTVTVNPVPVPNAGSPATACVGIGSPIGTTPALSGNTYSWSPAAGLSSTTASNPIATPASTTTYTVTQTITATGCKASASVTVTTLATPAANAGSNASICAGGSTILGAAAVSGDTYSWTPTSSLTAVNVAQPAASPSSTTTYTLTESNGTCSASHSVTVTINTPAAATAPSATICSGTPTSIGAAAVTGSTYSWVSSPAGFTSNSANPLAAPTVNTTYTVTETNSTGCMASHSMTLTMSGPVAAAAGSAQAICSGASATVGAVAVSGSTYSWTSSPSGFTSASANPTFGSINKTTTFTVTETNLYGCKASNSVKISVKNPAIAGTASIVCAGTSTTIGAAADAGSTYSWSPSAGLSASTVSSPTATPSATTTYTVTETNGSCINSNAVTITVNPLPVAVANSGTICSGTGTFQVGSNSNNSSYGYSWASSPSDAYLQNNYSVAYYAYAEPSSTTSYTETVTNHTTGCTNSYFATVTVNPIPDNTILGTSFAAGSIDSVCGGTVFNYSVATGTGLTYSWFTYSQPTSGSSSASSVTIVQPSTHGFEAYAEVRVSNSVTGCASNYNLIRTYTEVPAAAAAGASTTICPGSSITLGGAAVPGSTYSWVSSPSGFTSTLANPTVAPSVTTSYTVTETNAGGCTASNTVTVTIGSFPAAATGSANTVCSGTGIVLGATAVPGNTYSWTSSPSGFTSTSAQTGAAPTVTTTYTLTETNISGCQTTNSVTITVATPLAVAGSNRHVCSGNSTTLGAAAVTGSTYSWTSTPSGFTSTLASPSPSPTVNTTYTVTETNYLGCTASNSVSVTINTVSAGANPGVPSTICAGSTAYIGTLAVAGSSYSWSSSPSGFSSTSSNPAVSPTVTTVYTVTETNPLACTASHSVTITVSAAPTAAAGSPSTVCAGTSASIGAAAVTGSTYSWTSSPSGFTSASANPSVAPTVTTVYTVTETNSTGCSASNSVTVLVATPAAAVIAPKTICSAISTSLGAAAVTGSTYSWSSSPSGFSSASSNPSAAPTATTTYTLTETNINGCTNSNSVTLTVSIPAANAGSAPAAICLGKSTTIGASAVTGSTYSWSPTTGIATPSASITSVTPTATTTYTLTEKNSLGCSASHTVVVTTNPLPAAAAGSNVSICPNTSTTIGAAKVTGSTYSWTPTTGLSSTTISNPVATPPATTTYTVTETNSNGCVNSHSVTVTILVPPTANAGNPATVCAGNTIQIGAPSVAGLSYSWNPTTGLNSATIANPYATPTSTTTYTVTATGTCPGTATVTILVNPIPAANAGSSGAMCIGAANYTIGAASVAGHTYSWFPATGLSSASLATVTATPTQTTTYTLTEKITATGCTNSGTNTITVNPLPGANTGTGASICLGGSTVIGASPVLGSIYSWSSVPKGFTSTNSSATVSPIDTTVYTLVETDAITGCKNSNTVAVDVLNLPVANISTTPVCFGTNGVVVVNSATSGETFKWYLGGTLVPDQTSFQTITNVAGAYTAQVTNTNTGCSAISNVATLVINPLPNNIVKTLGSSVGCAGDSFVMVAPLDTNDTYQWKINGAPISGAANYIYAAKQTGLYNVILTSKVTSCSDSSNSFPVTMNPLPATPLNISGSTTFCNGKSVGFHTELDSGVNYTWYNGGVAITGADTNDYSATASGNYYVRITNLATGCGNASTNVPVTVNPSPVATASAGGNTNLCPGTSVLLLANPNSSYTYRWYNSAGYIAGATNDTFTVNQADNYAVTVTNTYGCSSNSNSETITAATYPKVSIVRPSSTKFCQNAVTLTVNDSNVGSYQWYLNGNIIPGATDSTLLVGQTGLYTVSVNGTATCTAHDTIGITINPAPVAAFYASSNSICDGIPVTFVNQSSISSTDTLSYIWSFGDGDSSTAYSPTYSYSKSGTNRVVLQAISASGCSSTVVDTITSLSVTSSAFSANNEGYGHYGFAPADLTGTTYTWYFGDSTLGYGKSGYHAYANSGKYKVTLVVTNANGCSSTTTETITVVVNSAIEQTATENLHISIFPNPFKTQTNVLYTLKQDASVEIQAFDINGKLVAHVENTTQPAGDHSYIFNGSVPGTYFIKMIIDGQTYVNRVVQQ